MVLNYFFMVTEDLKEHSLRKIQSNRDIILWNCYLVLWFHPSYPIQEFQNDIHMPYLPSYNGGFYPEGTAVLSVYWFKWKITLNNPRYHLPPPSILETTFYLRILQFNPQPNLSSQRPVVTWGSYRNPLAEEHNYTFQNRRKQCF